MYLSFNQGMTKIRQEFPTNEARNILRHRAEILRLRLKPEFEDCFSISPIDLKPNGSQTRLAFYEPGHVFGKYYEKNNMPYTEDLISDLSKMLYLYNLAVIRGGTAEFDNEPLGDQNDEQGLDVTLDELRKYRYHKTIERNQKLAKEAKKIHGYNCAVCGTNFEQKYGPIGRNFIEAHHKVPLHTLTIEGTITLSARDDFVVVCSNCHSMIHRKDAPPTFEEFLYLYQTINLQK